MRASSTASSNFGGSAAKPGASSSMSQGMMNSPSSVNDDEREGEPGKGLLGEGARGASPPSP